MKQRTKQGNRKSRKELQTKYVRKRRRTGGRNVKDRTVQGRTGQNEAMVGRRRRNRGKK